MGRGYARGASSAGAETAGQRCVLNDDFCVKTDEFCNKDDAFCGQSAAVCNRTDRPGQGL